MTLFFVTLMALSIMVFINTLYYTMSLLAMVVLFLYFLVSNSYITTLTMLVFLIVYVGAIIILIGYICAISPNLITSSSNSSFSPVVLLLGLLYEIDLEDYPELSYHGDLLANYFYSSFGAASLCVVLFMLFVTLLIVTSQYLSPNGPFRSITL